MLNLQPEWIGNDVQNKEELHPVTFTCSINTHAGVMDVAHLLNALWFEEEVDGALEMASALHVMSLDET